MTTRSYRLPNGERTTDHDAYFGAWRDLGEVVERATGWRLFAFDPTLSFRSPDGRLTAKLPAAIVLAWAARERENGK